MHLSRLSFVLLLEDVACLLGNLYLLELQSGLYSVILNHLTTHLCSEALDFLYRVNSLANRPQGIHCSFQTK